MSDEKRDCISSLRFADGTKILTNQKTNRTKEVETDGMHEEILPLEGKSKVSGTGKPDGPHSPNIDTN